MRARFLHEGIHSGGVGECCQLRLGFEDYVCGAAGNKALKPEESIYPLFYFGEYDHHSMPLAEILDSQRTDRISHRKIAVTMNSFPDMSFTSVSSMTA